MIPFDELCAALERHQARLQATAQPVETAPIDTTPAEREAFDDPDVARAASADPDDGLHEIELPDVLSDDEDSGR